MPLEQFSSYQIGKMLSVSRQAVNQWIDKGYIKSYRTPGGHRRVRRQDLMDFLEARGIPVPDVLRSLSQMDKKDEHVRVYIVDDDSDYATLMAKALEERVAMIKIGKYDNGYDALMEIGETLPDLLVLDLRMPKMDGVELCRRLKANPRTRNVPIIIVSAHEDKESVSALRTLNVSHIHSKSQPLKDIADTVALFLHRRQAAQTKD